MEIRLYLEMLRRSWWMIVVTMLAALNVALVSAYFATPQYQSNARFIVSPNPDLITGRDVINSLEALDKRSIISTYAEFLNSRRILQETLNEIQVSSSEAEQYTITTVVLPDANILELTVSGPNPDMAALLANSIGKRAIDYISRLYSAYDISILDPAGPAPTPFSPQPVRDAGLALVLGLIGGTALAIVSEQIRIPLETYRQRFRTDNVTGVFNSRYFRTLLEEEIGAKPDELLSVGIVEMQGLTEVLPTLPPVASQKLLRKVRDILRKELRGNDVIGRWNEISFAIMLPATPGTAASRTFQRIYQALCEQLEIEGYGMNIALDPHVGGAVFSKELSAADLLSQSESALEQARRDQQKPVVMWQMKSPFLTPKDG